jgi:hypothetical protein
MQRFGATPGSRALQRSRRLDELPLWRRDPAMPRQVFEVDVDGFGARAAHRGAPLSSDGAYGLVHASARYWPSEFQLLPELVAARWSPDNITWARSIDGRQTALLRGSMARAEGTTLRQFELLWFADDTRQRPHQTFAFTVPLEEAVGPCQFSLLPHVVFLAVGNEVRAFRIDGSEQVVARTEAKVSAYVESEDASLLLVGETDGGVSVWQIANGTLLQRLAGHRGEVLDVVFLDATRLFSAGADGTLRLWRLRDGRCAAVFVADAALVAADAAAAGRRVIAVDAQGNVHWMRVIG